MLSILPGIEARTKFFFTSFYVCLFHLVLVRHLLQFKLLLKQRGLQSCIHAWTGTAYNQQSFSGHLESVSNHEYAFITWGWMDFRSLNMSGWVRGKLHSHIQINFPQHMITNCSFTTPFNHQLSTSTMYIVPVSFEWTIGLVN